MPARKAASRLRFHLHGDRLSLPNCELFHTRSASCVTKCAILAEVLQMPTWLLIDLLVITVTVAAISTFVWIAP